MAILLAALVQVFVQVAAAQTTQQRVYASQSQSTALSFISGYNKDSQTGALSTIGGSPFNERFEGGLVAIDGPGKFLFVLNPTSNTISMFQIAQSTGALTEVPSSPFATGTTINPMNAPSNPVSIATEPSGRYVYVGYASGNAPPNAAITPFAIDGANLQIALTPQLSFDITGTPFQMLPDPKGLRLYVGTGANPAAGYTGADTLVYSIDSATGELFPAGKAAGGISDGRCIAMDPQGKFFYEGSGQLSGQIEGGPVSPVDGTGASGVSVNLGANNLPNAMLIDSSGKYLYVQESLGLYVYSIDPTSGQLTQALGPLANENIGRGTSAADPAGPFLYSLDPQGIHAYSIDPITGNLSEIAGSPFNVTPGSPLGSAGLAITGNSVQAVTGPVAALFPSTQDMGQIPIGQTSTTKVISVANTGGQALVITGITVTGTNATDFSETNTCTAPISPNANCSISLLFSPSIAGTEQAILQVGDNAPGSPQSATITGTGVKTQGAVTLTPGTLDFGTLAEGAAASSRSVTLTNSGNAPLTIASVLLGGANPGDFTVRNNCTGAPLQVQASCSITVTFTPQAQGQRSASLTISDDAPNSPQTIVLTGNVTAAFQLTAAGSGTTSATVTAGQTAQYSLQITPGPGYTGNINLTCSGAPVGAACTITPTSVTISNSSAVPIAVSVTTGGSAPAFLPVKGPAPWNYPKWWPEWSSELLAGFVLCLWFLRSRRKSQMAGSRGAWQLAAAFFLCVVAGISGCGGGGVTTQVTPKPTPPPAQPPPQPVVTPPGTSTLTVTATSGNLPAQTITLTLTVQ